MVHYNHLSSKSTAEAAAKWASKGRANDTMPDNKAVGWRKKMHSKPKELQPQKLAIDDAPDSGEASERHRHHGWRKTIQVSRPTTPVAAQQATSNIKDTEDGRPERVDNSVLNRESKPKLARYTSLFTNFKDVPKGPDFDEPWSDVPLSLEPYPDPEVALQSIRSHMMAYSLQPIPIEHNNGLFRIFETYHRLREENHCLQAELQETRHNLAAAKGRWANDERQYKEEIRRLEVFIAQGSAGVAGVLSARQGSVVDRKRLQEKSISPDKGFAFDHILTTEQLNREIKVRSQKVYLHRPSSPSRKMTTLSRRFTGDPCTDLRIGTPPPEEDNHTLSRKVKSELNLSRICHVGFAESTTSSSSTSDFSACIGNSLPDEAHVPCSTPVDMTIDCDALVAIRELGTLVARKRGLNSSSFINKLMMLLSAEEMSDGRTAVVTASDSDPKTEGKDQKKSNPFLDAINPKRTLRRFQSQPQLCSGQSVRRHFSFEPGEDYLQALKEDLRLENSGQQYGDNLYPALPVSSIHREPNLDVSPRALSSPHQAIDCDLQGSSKIPSPVQAVGSVRGKTSISSLRSTLKKPNDSRHNSQSSIMTAFRGDQTRNLRPSPSSRNSSSTTSRSLAMSPSLTHRPGTVRARNSVVDQTVAMESEGFGLTEASQSETTVSNIRSSTTDLSFRAAHIPGLPEFENLKEPNESDAGASE